MILIRVFITSFFSSLLLITACGRGSGGGPENGQNPKPVISGFFATKSPITAGSSTVLTAVFSNGTGSVDHGIGSITSGVGVSTGNLHSDTSFQLSVTGGGITITNNVMVRVVPIPIQPVISASLIATAGESGLTASVQDQPGMSYSWAIVGGEITSPPTGRSITFTAGSRGNMRITCIVTNAIGDQSEPGIANISIIEAPIIVGFSADRSLISHGTASVLKFSFSNGSGSIDQGVGTVQSNGEINVHPDNNTTYTLTVTNGAGRSVSASVSILVIPAPYVTSFSINPSNVNKGEKANLLAFFANGTGVVDQGIGVVSSGELRSTGPLFTPTVFSLKVTSPAGDSVHATVRVGVPDGNFSAIGDMGSGRTDHTATLLLNGNIFVAGGQKNNEIALGSYEILDSDTNTFSIIGSLTETRAGHTATMLANGKILLAGGWSDGWTTPYLKSAEVFDPATRTCSSTGSMFAIRFFHSATRLLNGKVLVVGGRRNGGFAVSGAEIYDPETGQFSPTGSLLTGRYLHSATLLPNGQVLIVGGFNGARLASSEIYNPATGLFSYTGEMVVPRVGHFTSVLQDGRILIAGGQNGLVLNSAEIFNPETGRFSLIKPLTTPRMYGTATLLPNGYVLLAGGNSDMSPSAITSAELFDPWFESFIPLEAMNEPRRDHRDVLLPNGTVVLIGGFNSTMIGLSSCEIFK